MKLKALVLALFVAGLTASVAIADNGNGKSKGNTNTATTTKAHPAKPCKPKLELQFAGTVTSLDGSNAVVNVTKGRAQGASLKGDSLTLDVSKARVRGNLAANAKVMVHARACIDLSVTPAAVSRWATQVKATAAS
jgi:hypothetical protein